MTAAAAPGRTLGSQILAGCREEGRAALIGYLPVGYPTVPESIAAMEALIELSLIHICCRRRAI